jgi:hypothetical protein
MRPISNQFPVWLVEVPMSAVSPSLGPGRVRFPERLVLGKCHQLPTELALESWYANDQSGKAIDASDSYPHTSS